ncbi:MAG: type II toxin-antitoxin system RatA family toxin [Rhizobiales bacterium]|jgi:coenzyme Q-binding protein COQ10|nr:type II toxin-antitoxin system RatA family toxin [Hyphomicrobiales bacterium]
MNSYRTTRRVKHSAAKMFDLVADVEKYPEFVPMCESLHIRKRSGEAEGVEIIIADMTVAYKIIRETFSSRVTLDRPKLSVLVEYLDGPFSHLENRWRFRPENEKVSEVDFYIAYEFKSKMLGMVMGALFDSAFRRFAEAFERRADKIYREKAV